MNTESAESTVKDLADIFSTISFDKSASEKYDTLCTECDFLGVDCWIDEDGDWYYLNLQSLPDSMHEIDEGFRIAKAGTKSEKSLARGIGRAVLKARKFLQDFPFDSFGARVPL